MRYRDIPPYGLRLQPPLKAKLDEIVRQKKEEMPDWSLNAEISKRLEESFGKQPGVKEATDGELIDELIRRWGRDAVYIQLGKKE